MRNMRDLMFCSVSSGLQPSIILEGVYQNRLYADGRSPMALGIVEFGALGASGEVDLVSVYELYMEGDCLGDVVIREDVLHSFYIGGKLGGHIHVHGDVNAMYLRDDWSGDIIVDGDLALAAR